MREGSKCEQAGGLQADLKVAVPFEKEQERECQGAEEEEDKAVAERVVVVDDERGHRGPAREGRMRHSILLSLYEPLKSWNSLVQDTAPSSGVENVGHLEWTMSEF